jgi:hypothetical protein
MSTTDYYSDLSDEPPLPPSPLFFCPHPKPHPIRSDSEYYSDDASPPDYPLTLPPPKPSPTIIPPSSTTVPSHDWIFQLPPTRKVTLREQKWNAMFSKFEYFRSQKKKTLNRRILKGIPNSLRGKAWLYILHPDSVKYDSQSANFKDPRKKRFIRWSKQPLRVLSPPPQWIPGLPPLQTDLSNLIIALLAADSTKLEYTPNFGYIASLFLAYLPNWSAFTAFLYLMTASKHRICNYFHENKLANLAAVWDLLLQKKDAKIHQKLLKVEVEHQDYLRDWLQTAFLKIPLRPELRLRVFDRFVRFGTPALFAFGIVVVGLVAEEIKVKGKGEIIRLLEDPTKSGRFRNVDDVIRKFEKVVVGKKEYKVLCSKCGFCAKDLR